MQGKVAQYLNEIVSLTIMALMIVALVSAQRAPLADAGALGPVDVVVLEDFSFRQAGELQ